jgi:hypothetical protein
MRVLLSNRMLSDFARTLLGGSVAVCLMVPACDRPALTQVPPDSAASATATADAANNERTSPDLGVDAAPVDASTYTPPREDEPPEVCYEMAIFAIREALERCWKKDMEQVCGHVVEEFDAAGWAKPDYSMLLNHGPKFMECFDAESRMLWSCARGQRVSVYSSCLLE